MRKDSVVTIFNGTFGFVSTLISMSGLDQNLSLVIRSLLVDPKEVVASPEYRLEKEVEAMNLKYR